MQTLNPILVNWYLDNIEKIRLSNLELKQSDIYVFFMSLN